MSSNEEEEEQEELPEVDQAGAEGGAGPSSGTAELYPVGSWVVAVYRAEWYVAQVEGEEPEEEEEGFTLLNYMERSGFNQFRWGKKKDVLKTRNCDILLKIDPPIPVSSRHMGLPKNLVSKVYHHFRVQWLFICWNLFCLFSFQKNILKPNLLEPKTVLSETFSEVQGVPKWFNLKCIPIFVFSKQN